MLLVGLTSYLGWPRDPSLARSDYVGAVDASTEDAKLHRPVPFECHVGWLRLDKGGASIRATRWLSEARLNVGDLRVTALFVEPVEKAPGDGFNAGCPWLDEGPKPAQDAPLSLDGSPVRE